MNAVTESALDVAEMAAWPICQCCGRPLIWCAEGRNALVAFECRHCGIEWGPDRRAVGILNA